MAQRDVAWQMMSFYMRSVSSRVLWTRRWLRNPPQPSSDIVMGASRSRALLRTYIFGKDAGRME